MVGTWGNNTYLALCRVIINFDNDTTHQELKILWGIEEHSSAKK
ncbi:hypothetical protein HMPREF1247_0600 [Atopobium sp. BV3Ac4]|nr:hypothetical protein HMPREF1247_0600 [Atopobium sp. BV3Ac4]